MADPNHSNDRSDDSNRRMAFDIEIVCQSLQKCIEDKNAIDLDHYLNGFNELLRFFHLLGAVFTFVANDVQSKINILDKYSKCSEIGIHYKTVQKMIDYEKSNNLLELDLNKRPSGSRTLLRLHRALEFVSHFMLELSRLEDDKGTATVARDCYKKTLAIYHPWYIKKSASLAMYTMPYRHQLVERAYCGNVPDNETQDSVLESMSRLAVVAEEVFNATQKLYDEHQLLELP
jgi:hypothetical protein